MFKNIIFDWSGVVKDSVHDHLLVVNKIFKEFGANEITLQDLKENWEQPYMRFYNKYLPNLTFEEEQDAYKRAVVQSPKAKSCIGIAEAIKDFQNAKINMAVLSSDFPETLLPEIADFNLRGVFLEVITNVHDKSKGIQQLISKHGFKPEETVFIGDSNHEIEEGKNAGIKTVAVTWGFSTEERLAALNPDFLVHNIDELKSVILA